jgi:hypothetical protein
MGRALLGVSLPYGASSLCDGERDSKTADGHKGLPTAKTEIAPKFRDSSVMATRRVS